MQMPMEFAKKVPSPRTKAKLVKSMMTALQLMAQLQLNVSVLGTQTRLSTVTYSQVMMSGSMSGQSSMITSKPQERIATLMLDGRSAVSLLCLTLGCAPSLRLRTMY